MRRHDVDYQESVTLDDSSDFELDTSVVTANPQKLVVWIPSCGFEGWSSVLHHMTGMRFPNSMTPRRSGKDDPHQLCLTQIGRGKLVASAICHLL